MKIQRKVQQDATVQCTHKMDRCRDHPNFYVSKIKLCRVDIYTLTAELIPQTCIIQGEAELKCLSGEGII